MSASLGLELRARREAAGLTQGAVAKRLGVARATITQWEQDTHRPKPENLSRLDKIFGARGELLRLAEGAEPESAHPRRLFLSDIFRDVADALIGTLVKAEDGRPRGWSHNLTDTVPTPLSTAFVVRTLQQLDDARVDLHGLREVFESRRKPAGWSNRPSVEARPEVTAIVLAALSRLGQLADVDEAVGQLDGSLDKFALSRPFVIAVVLESLLTIRPDAPLVGRLIRTLLDARQQDGNRMLWTMDATAPASLVEPSLAHTARATAVLRLAQPVVDSPEVDEAIAMAVEWMIGLEGDDSVTEILQFTPLDRTADVPIHHFTAAMTIRGLAGIPGVPEHRIKAAEASLWDGYSVEHHLWAWRADGTLPSWMTHDAVCALRQLAATSTPTPITTHS